MLGSLLGIPEPVASPAARLAGPAGLDNLHRGWVSLDGSVVNGHVLVDLELVKHVGLIVEVEAW
jgi:hypothetical protein